MPRPRHHATANRNGPTQRQLRVGELLRHTLAAILREGNVRDVDLAGVSVTITEVKTSPDMRHSTVFCEPLGGKDATKVIKALNRHKAFIRGELGRQITLRFTPELHFVEDTSFAEAERIETILKSPLVARDLEEDEAEDDEDKNGDGENGDASDDAEPGSPKD